MSRKKIFICKTQSECQVCVIKKKFWIKDEVFLLNAYSQYYCLIEKSFCLLMKEKFL